MILCDCFDSSAGLTMGFWLADFAPGVRAPRRWPARGRCTVARISNRYRRQRRIPRPSTATLLAPVKAGGWSHCRICCAQQQMTGQSTWMPHQGLVAPRALGVTHCRCKLQWNARLFRQLPPGERAFHCMFHRRCECSIRPCVGKGGGGVR